MVGIMASVYSITETFAPKRAYTEPNSNPITPPPIITKCFGTSVMFNASVLVIMRFLSIAKPGNEAGFDPVAIITLSVSINCSVSPVTLI